MPIARFQMPDGRIGRFEVPEGTTPEQAQTLIQQSLQQTTPTRPQLTEQQIADQLERAAISSTRAEQPGLAKAADIAGGFTGLTRSALGKIADFGERYRSALGMQPVVKPISVEEAIPTRGVDKGSLSYLAGSLVDPLGISAFGAGTKLGTLVPKIGKYAQGVAGGAIGGGAIGGLSEEGDAGTGAVVGGVTSAVLPPVISRIAKGVNRIAQPIATKVKEFETAGTTPTLGQATQNSFFRGLENLVSKFPGGSSVMLKFNEKQQANIGKNLKTGVSAEDAGRAIESGIKGEGGFLARTKQTWQELDDAVAAKIPKNFGVIPVNTVQTLNDLTAPIKGAEATSLIMRTPKLAEISAAIKTDLTKNPSMPYQSIRELRSKVGALLDDSLTTGIPNGELKKLYGALSKDLEAAANQAGAGKEFTRQNNFYRARMGRIENVLEKIVGKGKQPEDIFKTFYPSDPDQANKVRATLRSLNPSERQVVTDAVVSRLGKASAGKQDEFGEIFSTETFLTNWNKLSKGAKAQLFPDAKMRSNLEHVARVAGNIREGSGVFKNASGTAGSFAAYSVYASPIVSVATGSPFPLMSAAGATATANIGAKMLTNPKIVNWLAKGMTMKTLETPQHFARLAVIYNNTKDEELKNELDKYMQSIQEE